MEIDLIPLAEFTGDKAAEVVGDLLPYTGEIIMNLDKETMNSAKNNFAALGMMVKAAPAAFLGIVKTLSRNPVDVETLGAGETASAIFQLASDRDFLRLFGYQSKTSPTSGSASESTEGAASTAS